LAVTSSAYKDAENNVAYALGVLAALALFYVIVKIIVWSVTFWR